jgi:hypothetical protein
MIRTQAQIINAAVLPQLKTRLWALSQVDFSPLMETWELILAEDNRKGVLEGKDGWDRAAPPLAYRNGAGQRTAARKGIDRGTVQGREKGKASYEFANAEWFKRRVASKHFRPVATDRAAPGRGNARPRAKERRKDMVILANNNLSTRAYQRFTGPRLAPRRDRSRVITNYMTRSGRKGSAWFAEGYWPNSSIVSEKGVPFLQFHFDGAGVPQYNLARLRQWGLNEARRELLLYVRGKLRTLKGGGNYATKWRQARVEATYGTP